MPSTITAFCVSRIRKRLGVTGYGPPPGIRPSAFLVCMCGKGFSDDLESRPAVYRGVYASREDDLRCAVTVAGLAEW